MVLPPSLVLQPPSVSKIERVVRHWATDLRRWIFMGSDRPHSPSALAPEPAPVTRSFFPSVSDIWTPGDVAAVPERVTEPTVFGADLVTKPLAAHDTAFSPANYPGPTDNGVAGVPTRPTDFKDPYLFPTLSKHERERVTSLWYYTRDIQSDKKFLAHMQQTIDLIRDLTERDCVIMGLLDMDYYTRLVTSNVPLAVIPRREATCSHTILQEPGSVFMVSDMKQDWRFSTSPHVEAGLGFYAGTALRYRVSGASSDIAFGSLCIASWEKKPPLTETQQRALKRFSDILVYSIVERARSIRSSDRHKMTLALSRVTAQATVHNVVELVIGALQTTYPTATIGLQVRPDGTIKLTENRDVPYSEFNQFLWEDSAAIDEHIYTSNHIPMPQGTKSLRALAVKRSSEEHTYLVVQTSDLKYVFDDIDASFVQSCALIMCNIIQAHRLNEAIAAKTAFLRGASHQLRTPIHAILSTCELLLDHVRAQAKQLAAGALLDSANNTQNGDVSLTHAASTLHLIDTAGRSLLSTVNNLLNFDRLNSVRPVKQLISLAILEQEVLDQFASAASDREFDLICDNQLPPEVHLVDGDLDLLKQCIGAILQNAVDATSTGSVVFRTSLDLESGNSALVFDVIDTGIGIAEQDRERIFLPFEKIDILSTRPGLGLTVASSIATTLNGTVTLVASSKCGSHFRLRLENTTLACKRDHMYNRLRKARIPRTYHMLSMPSSTMPLVHAAEQMECLGFSPTSSNAAAIILSDITGSLNAAESVLKSVLSNQLVLFLCCSETEVANISALAVHLGMGSRVVGCAGPLGRNRLWWAIKILVDGWESSSFLPPSRALPPSPSPATQMGLRQRKRTLAALNVLIVDDNRTNLDILCMNAKRRKFIYCTAMDGVEAVEAFINSQAEGDGADWRPVSLILMDLQMPNMNGAEATAQIRKYEKEHSLPQCLIYMVTGQSSDDDKRISVEAGADGFFVKPLSLRTLNDLIYHQFPK